MKKVLVTGGLGFIGSHLVDKLLENNYRVVIVDNLSRGFSRPQTEDNCFNCICDILDTENLESAFQTEPDYCIHLAAQVDARDSMIHPEVDTMTNVLGSLNVFKLCKKYGVKKVLVASSAAVYGTPEISEIPIKETYKGKPESMYGLNKLVMENYFRLLGLKGTIFRFSNVYGKKNALSDEFGIINIFQRRMISNKDINIFGDGSQIRDYVHVNDIVKAFLNVLDDPTDKYIGKTLNLSTGTGVSLIDLFNTMKKIFDYKKDPIFKEAVSGDLKVSILDNSEYLKLSNETFLSLNDGLKLI